MRSLILLLVVCHASRAAAESHSVGEGVVVTGNTVYLMDPDGSIHALDLATGKQRWSSKAAAKPFAQVGSSLVAQAEDGKLRVLDAKTGKLKCKLTTEIGFADGLGLSSTAIGFADAKHAWITWRRETFYAGGAPPPPDVQQAAHSVTTGTWLVDPVACTAKDVPYPGTDVDLDSPGASLDKSTWTAKPKDTFFEVTFRDDAGKTIVADVKEPITPALLVGKKLVGRGWVFDFATKKLVWKRTVRSLAYNGPYPP